jgi:hypothetical protein
MTVLGLKRDRPGIKPGARQRCVLGCRLREPLQIPPRGIRTTHDDQADVLARPKL